MKEGYIKRKTSTIPFGYETSEVEGYFKPVPKQIDALNLVSEMVYGEEISLATAVDWTNILAPKGLTAVPAADTYLYLVASGGATNNTYTAGKFVIKLYGYDA